MYVHTYIFTHIYRQVQVRDLQLCVWQTKELRAAHGGQATPHQRRRSGKKKKDFYTLSCFDKCTRALTFEIFFVCQDDIWARFVACAAVWSQG